jgi:hypothetical protein
MNGGGMASGAHMGEAISVSWLTGFEWREEIVALLEEPLVRG